MSHSVQEFFLNKKIGLQEIFFQKAPPPPPPTPSKTKCLAPKGVQNRRQDSRKYTFRSYR